MSTNRGVTKHRSMQEWLNSKPPGKKSLGKMLSGWKDFKKGTGEIDTWLHTKTLPMTVWRHPFPMLIAVEDKKTKDKVVHVWSRNHTCHETEDVLDKLYWREEKGVPTSAREKPPERCGMCKFAEWVWQECWAWIESHSWFEDKEAGVKEWRENKKGKGRGIDPCAVLFRFVSEADDDENTTIHAGGYCGLFGRDELPDDLVKAMQAHKIRAGLSWKESCVVKAKSVMCVVDNDDANGGVKISEETKELGEKVKEEITRVLKSLDIDIQKRPYCIRWEYDKSKNMGKQYTATAMMKIKPSPQITALIKGDAPDLAAIEKPFNQQEMRGIFERHCKLPKGTVPWDEIWPTKEQEKQWAEEDAEAAAAAAAEEQEDDSADEGEGYEGDGEEPAGDDEADAEHDDDGEELVACDECGKAMKISASKCPHCGHAYEVEQESEPPPPPPKPMRSRSEVAAAKKAAADKPNAVGKAAAKAAEKKKAAAKPGPDPDDNDAAEPDEDDEEEGDDNQDGSIPF